MENNVHDVIKSNNCIEGGTYEAYIKAREFIMNSYISSEKIISYQKDVGVYEFLEAVKVLMTFASMHPDVHVDLYDCDMCCKHFKSKPCPGECMLSDKSRKRCPFYQK